MQSINAVSILFLFVFNCSFITVFFVIDAIIFRRKDKTTLLYIASKLFQAVSVASMLIRGNTYNIYLIIFGIILYYTGIAGEVFTIISIDSPKQSRHKIFYGSILLISCTTSVIITLMHLHHAYRLFTTGIFSFLVYFYFGLELLLNKNESKVQKVIGCFSVLFSIPWLFRTYYSINHLLTVDTLSSNIFQHIAYIGNVIFLSVVPMLYLFILKEKDNNELKAVNRKQTETEIELRKSKEYIENELSKSQALFKAFMDNIPVMTYIKDPQLNYFFVNNHARILLNVKSEPAGAVDFFPEKTARMLESMDKDVIDKEKSITFEFELKEKEKWFQGIKFPIKISENEILLGGATFEITDLKEAQSELHQALDRITENEKKYRSIFDNSPIGIFHYDKNGIATDCNTKFSEILGTTKEKIIGLNTIEDLPNKKMTEKIKQSLSSGRSYYEDIYTSLTGTKTNYLRVLFEAIYDDHGNITGGLGIVEDITERKKAEKELFESEKKYIRLFEDLPFAAYRTSLKGDIIEANRESAIIFGYDSVPDMKNHINLTEDIYPNPEDRQKVIELLSKKDIAELEHKFKRRDGSLFDARMTIRKTVDSNGNVEFTGIIEDVTELRKTERELKKEKRFTEKVLNSLPGLFFMYKIENGKTMLIRWNKNHETLFGYSSSELYGLPANTFFNEEEPESSQKALDDLLNKGISDSEVVTRKKDGSFLLAHRFISFLFEDEGEKYIIGTGFDISERVKAEAELKKANQIISENEKKYRSIFNNSPLGIFHYDTKGIITDCNTKFIDINGSSREKLVGLNLIEKLPDKKMVRAIEQSLLTGKGYFEDLYTSYTGNKTTYQRILYTALYDNSNRITGGIGIVEDISDRKKAEKELEETFNKLSESEEKFRAVFYTSPDTICINTMSGEYIDVNENFTLLSGYASKNILGKTTLEINAWADPEDMKVMFKKIQKKGMIDNFETRFRTKNGSIITILLSAKILLLNKIPHIVSISKDISKIKKIEEELTLLKDNLEELVETRTAELKKVMNEQKIILDNIGLGVIFLVDRKVTWANQKFAYMFGFDSGIPFGTSSRTVYEDEKDYIEFGKKAHDSIAKNETFITERIFYRRDRTTFWCRLIGTAVDPNDLSKGSIWIFYDISERKKSEKALKEAKEQAETANRAKSEFLANMSHEIRTPMNAILGFSEILQDKIKGNPQHDEYLKGINVAGKNLLMLINDILDLSKVESGKFEIQKEPANIKEIIEEIYQIFRLNVRGKNLVFNMHLDENLPKVLLLDETRLRQVLFNLMGNAVKFTDKGKIEINARSENHNKSRISLIIGIMDTGMGVPEEQQKIIFEPFIQQKGQKQSKYKGTGLGLSISTKLVEIMGGTISLESKPGKGSLFTIHIPDVEISEAKKSYSDEILQINLGGIKFKPSQILYAEDVSSNRKIIKAYLEDYSVEVDFALNGREALEMLDKKDYQLVIMDIEMPEMNGIEASKKIRESENLKEIPILALSASTIQSEEKLVLEYCNEFLGKPISKRELIYYLAKYLPHSEEKKFNNETAQNIVTLPDEKELSLIKNKQEDLLPITDLYNQIKDTISINETGTLAEMIEKFGIEHNSNFMIKYGKELSAAVKVLNIDKIEELLKLFGEL